MEENITMYMNKQPGSMSTSPGKKTALKVKNCSAQELITTSLMFIARLAV